MFLSPCFYSTQMKQSYHIIAYWICNTAISSIVRTSWQHLHTTVSEYMPFKCSSLLTTAKTPCRSIFGYTNHAKWYTKWSNLSFLLHFALEALIFLQAHSFSLPHLLLSLSLITHDCPCFVPVVFRAPNISNTTNHFKRKTEKHKKIGAQTQKGVSLFKNYHIIVLVLFLFCLFNQSFFTLPSYKKIALLFPIRTLSHWPRWNFYLCCCAHKSYHS